MSANPTLYQLHTRDWLRRLARPSRPSLTLDQIPDEELERFAGLGFEWLYLLGIWQTGSIGRQISSTNAAWLPGYEQALSDFTPADVCGSPFAVLSYHVHQDFGGDAALAVLRGQMSRYGLRLMLDFVPNHTALDHSWIVEHRARFIQGSLDDLQREPLNYWQDPHGSVIAHGRDPYFPGWADTAQLDWSDTEVADAMRQELLRIAAQCDGLRCDMAMLILPHIFARTWQRAAVPFWSDAIQAVRGTQRAFVFCAEVYWGLEYELQQLGFDYTYDKTLYDRLSARDAGAVRGHLLADLDFQRRLARFLENHDEPRAAHEFAWPVQRAAATLAFTIPGLRFLHEGQLTGATRKPSIHLCRRAQEPESEEIRNWYAGLLHALHEGKAQGDWRLFEAKPAWNGNPSCSAIIAYGWRREDQWRELAIVNYSDHASQAYIALPELDSSNDTWMLNDELADIQYERPLADLRERGLYVDLPPWGSHLFSICIAGGIGQR